MSSDPYGGAPEPLPNGHSFQRTDNAILIRSHDGRRLWHNPAFCELEAQLGPGSTDLARLFETVTGPAEGELRLQRASWTRWRMLRVPWPSDGPAQLWMFDDITAYVLTRQALEEAQGKLRLLSANTKGILFEFDARARFVRVWTSDPKLLLRPEPELLGRTLVEALGPELGSWHHERVCHTLGTGEDQSYEYTVEVPSGATNFACTSVALPSPEGGAGRGAAFWIRDITEEVQLRSKLQRADRLAAVGTLAAGVAHEVNNPLGYMRLNLEHVRRELVALSDGTPLGTRMARLVRPLEMVLEGAERVHTIVSALLNLTRATDSRQIVDVRLVLERCLEVAAQDLNGRVRVQRGYAAVPPVSANETRLVQVFSNLLTNATQAMSASAGEHTLQVSTQMDTKGHVVVEIADTGPGIPRENLQRVFDPFFTTKESGLGLGLAICQRIVSSFGGEIDVDSRPGSGATFRVSLPAAVAQARS